MTNVHTIILTIYRVSDELVVKVADFGLSKDIYETNYYQRGWKSSTPLPIKWMAIETLRDDGVFTSKADVVSHIPSYIDNYLCY